MKFIVGIGNPGKKYEKTRHNVGFEVLESLAGSAWKKDSKLDALVAKGEGVLYVKPETFVNLSGRTALAMAKWHHAKPGDVLVVCDDVNLPFGKIRLRAKGSAGGHHGLESIADGLDSLNFPRLRVGVANASMPKDLAAFVLEPFNGVERKALNKILEGAASVCRAWAQKDLTAAQTLLSRNQQKE